MKTPHPAWSPAPEAPIIADREVHVWRARLDVPSSHVQRLRGTLTADELERAKRFSFDRDRQRFITARATLRSILSRYTGTDPGHLRFSYNPSGKPGLAAEFSACPLHFNLSHSDDLALYTVTLKMPVGVDLERVRSGVEVEEIARHFFSVSEVDRLRRVPAAEKLEAFYHCWTRKEAYSKAQGKGLSLPLDSFEVSFAPGEPARLLPASGEPREHSLWTLLELMPGPGYVGALAVRGIGCRFKYWEWGP